MWLWPRLDNLMNLFYSIHFPFLGQMSKIKFYFLFVPLLNFPVDWLRVGEESLRQTFSTPPRGQICWIELVPLYFVGHNIRQLVMNWTNFFSDHLLFRCRFWLVPCAFWLAGTGLSANSVSKSSSSSSLAFHDDELEKFFQQ